MQEESRPDTRKASEDTCGARIAAESKFQPTRPYCINETLNPIFLPDHDGNQT